MFFSIVIPTYNREKIVLNALRSITAQTFSDFEIILVDDGSTDATEEVIKTLNDPKIRYYKTENFGVAHARNYGIKKASGSYVTFLDSDDLLENFHFQTAFNFISENNSPEIIHLNFKWGYENRSNAKENKLPAKLPDNLFMSCSLHVNCLFIRADIAKANLFNESKELMFAEDWDYFMKLSVRYKILLKNKCSAYLIDHEDRNRRNFEKERWILKKNALIKSLNEDKIIGKEYKNKIKKVEAHMDSLIAVNLAFRKQRKEGFYFFARAIFNSPSEIFTRRTGAILKHLLTV